MINMADDRYGLLDSIGDGVFVTDRGLRVAFWNRAAEDITGFTASAMAGRRVSDRDALRLRTLSGAALSGEDELLGDGREGAGGIPRLVRMDSGSGMELVTSLDLWPLFDAQGETTGYLGRFRPMEEEHRRRKLAEDIHARMVRTGTTVRAGLRIEAVRLPAPEAGGDYLETFFLDGDVLMTTMAETGGRGMSSTLIAMVYRTLLHASFAKLRAPGEVLAAVNRGFLETAGMDGDPLAAGLLAVDPALGEARWASAGFPAALQFRREASGFRKVETRPAAGFRLGTEEDAGFPETAFRLERGDMLLLGSPGLFDAECIRGGPYGADGVVRFLAGYGGGEPVQDLVRAVRKESPFEQPPADLSAVAVTRL